VPSAKCQVTGMGGESAFQCFDASVALRSDGASGVSSESGGSWSGRVRRIPVQREKPDGNHEPCMTGAKCHNSRTFMGWMAFFRS